MAMEVNNLNHLVSIIKKEKDILNKMIEECYGDINNDSILEQSIKVDKYIVEYLRTKRGCNESL